MGGEYIARCQVHMARGSVASGSFGFATSCAEWVKSLLWKKAESVRRADHFTYQRQAYLFNL